VLYYWVRSQGVPSDETADLVQDVFAVLVEKLPKFQYDRKQSFGRWLRTIAVNKCRDYHRRRGSRPSTAGAAIEPAAPDDIEQFSVSEYRRCLASQALQIMQDEFQPATWKACWECVAAGRPAAEVARELGISVNAVYVAKCRVLRRLREELEGLWE
jgi:RNA polymerase sigma-70 factor (ECF subfamily)